MIVKKVQNQANQNVLLIVHDDSGAADIIISSMYKLLEDMVIYHQSGNLPNTSLVNRYFLSEVQESDDGNVPESM